MKEFLKYTFATVCGLLIFSGITSLLGLMLLGAMVALSEPTTQAIKPNSVYVIDLKGTLVERAEDNEMEAAMAELTGQEVVTTVGLNDLLSNIEKAKNDTNIVAIYLRGSSLTGGYASFAALRDALADFKATGKPIVAFAENYSQGNYYLASVADKVYVGAHGSVAWQGIYANTMFFSRALDKLGIEMQVLKVGTFKSAVEPYILTEMSDANRLQNEVMIGDLWEEVLADVSASRNLTPAQLNALADQYLAVQDEETLMASGLIDSMIYKQSMEPIIKGLLCESDFNVVSSADVAALPEKDVQKLLATDKVAVLYAEGEITDSSGEGIVGTKLVKEIDKLADDDNVKAVVLRVNSPGGSAAASENIWHALSVLKGKKPLVVSMGDYAASGGYYISCLADTILAEPHTLTGSIGIFGLVPNVSKLMNKIGVDFDGVGTNAHSDMEANMMYKGMNRQERQMMQAMINRGYELFVRRCADGRGVSTDAIQKIAEGRVWSGKRAVELGLVDALGNTDDAIAIAARMAGLDNYKVVEYPKKKDQLTELLELLSPTPSKPELLLKQVKAITEPTVMARLPYHLVIE